MRGKTISIYLPDSNPRSIKICDINTSIVRAFLIPRNKLGDFSSKEELSCPGVYFLIGEKTDSGKNKIYIGEAENLFSRIRQHNKDSNKDFWNLVICFISDKKNINKAHIKYLENYCCNEAKRIDRCELVNSTNPTQSSLTEQDKDFILDFYDDLKILIATLGYPIFEEIKKDKKNLFFCKGKEAIATGEYNEEGLLVFKGSKVNIEESKTAGSWVINMRKNLIDRKILIENDSTTFIFKDDFLFSSPSASAAVVLGRRANGWTEWKNKDGKTLDELFRK